MTTQTKEKTTRAVTIATQERKITLTFDDVKKYLCPRASDPEIALFLKTCQSLGLNPFARDCYLVKYTDEEAASIIIAIDAFLKAAETCLDYAGHEAGVILKKENSHLDFREGAFVLEEEEKQLVGGWAKVYRKDRDKPFYSAVNIKEYQKFTRQGKPTRFWNERPATMIRKVALSHALREAFPNRFAGMTTTAEYEEIPEGKLLPVLEKGGKPDWRKFWAMVKSELGLTPEEARLLLGVGSIKEELIDAGWTMEKIWDELVKARRLQQTTETEVKADEAWGAIEKEAEIVKAEAKKPKRDPETIRTINELLQACYDDFKLQPKQVLAELNVNSQEEITELPSECYRRIAAVR